MRWRWLASRIPQTAYMASLAPPLAAPSAAGVVMSWRPPGHA